MKNLRFKRNSGGIVLLAILAAALFAVSPVMLQHHHHAHQQDSASCSLCIFASGLVIHPPTQSVITCPLAAITLLAPRQETPPLASPSHFHGQRSPPAA